jgi:hypothetical protein
MDALQLLKKLREEKNSKSQTIRNTESTKNIEASAVGDRCPVSSSIADRALWESDCLLVRRWGIGGRELQLFEDPLGKFQAGNGATLW